MELKDLVGKTLVEVRGAVKGSELVSLFFDDKTRVDFYHSQDCCESVSVEDVVGDIADLIGRPLGLCEEVVTRDRDNDYDESSTATWYKFVTNEGAVTIRWYGTSNGYYSESVNYDFGTYENL